MPLPALAAVAGLAAAAHLGRRGSAATLSVKNKKRIIDLVKQGLVSEAKDLATDLGLDALDLSGANLARANLVDANLSNANLTDATLYHANLAGAVLAGANLTHANLHRANLFDTNLSGADLTGASLTDAILTGANLSGANLTGADIEEAIEINIGPTRTFIGIPFRHIEARSPFVPGRTTLRRTE